jgi:hypothetical protein
MIMGAPGRDTQKVLMPDGLFECWSVKAYNGLKENQVTFIDCVSSKTYDLCEIARCRAIRKKMDKG